MAGGVVACSRNRNFHFDRPPKHLLNCYFQSLGCASPKRDTIIPTRTDNKFIDACAEKGALRQLFLGPSLKLLELGT
jgi:hypothetical protein